MTHFVLKDLSLSSSSIRSLSKVKQDAADKFVDIFTNTWVNEFCRSDNDKCYANFLMGQSIMKKTIENLPMEDENTVHVFECLSKLQGADKVVFESLITRGNVGGKDFDAVSLPIIYASHDDDIKVNPYREGFKCDFFRFNIESNTVFAHDDNSITSVEYWYKSMGHDGEYINSQDYEQAKMIARLNSGELWFKDMHPHTRKYTMDTMNDLNQILSPHHNPRYYNGKYIGYIYDTPIVNGEDWSNPIAGVLDEATAAAGVIEKIAGIGSITHQSIESQTCLGFACVHDSTDARTLARVKPGMSPKVVDIFLKPVCENFDYNVEHAGSGAIATKEDCLNYMSSFDGTWVAGDQHWVYDGINFDSVNVTKPQWHRVWKTVNEDEYSNWVLAQSIGTVKVAPDTLVIHQETRTLWGLLPGSEQIIIQQTPHKITGDDMIVLETFFESVLLQAIAQTLQVSSMLNTTIMQWPTGYCG